MIKGFFYHDFNDILTLKYRIRRINESWAFICIYSVRQIPSDKLTNIFHSQILKKPFIADILAFNSNKIKIVDFTQEFVFVRKNLVLGIENEFNVWFWKMHFLSILYDRWTFDCVRTAVKLKNLKIVVIFIPLPLAHLYTHII